MFNELKKLICIAKRQYSTKKIIKKRLLNCTNFLKSDTYISNYSFSAFYAKDNYLEQENKFLYQEVLFDTLTKFECFIVKLFFKPIKIKVKHAENKEFLGDSVIIPTLDKEIKFISHSENKMLTLFNEKSRYEYLLQKRKYWAEHFNTVKLFSTNDQKLYLIEEFIKKQPFDYNIAFDKIFDDYCNYLTDVASNLQNKSNFYYTSETQNFLSKHNILDKYEELKSYIESPHYKVCLNHGDLYRYNVLFDGQQYYYIDFENIGEHVFYFDVLLYIYDESYTFKNHTLLKNYMSGKYDDKLEKMFSICNETYNKEKRALYMLTAIVEFYCAHINSKEMLKQIEILFNKTN